MRFVVSYVSNDAQTAKKVTERLASLFIEENLRDREGLAEGANQFLESQLDDARRKLVEHETKLADYKRQYNGELPSQTQANLQVIGEHSEPGARAVRVDQPRPRPSPDARAHARRRQDRGRGREPRAVCSDSRTGNNGRRVCRRTARSRESPVARRRTAVEAGASRCHPDETHHQGAREESRGRGAASPDLAARSRRRRRKPAGRTRSRDLSAELDNLDKQIAHKAETQTKL